MNRRALILAVAIIALLVGALVLPIKEWLGQLLAWIDAHRQIAWLAFIGCYIAACVLLLPGLILTIAAGALFGLVQGVLLVSVASVAGATAAFLVGRTFARDWARAKAQALPRFAALDRALEQKGFLIVLLTRLSPLFPFNLLNYAYGLTGVRLRDYVVASWIGMLPATVVYVYVGSAAANLAQVARGDVSAGRGGRTLFIIGLLATLAVAVLATRAARRALDRALEAS
jgi:uncharacterized membrane protein YdjX (TVP38/TMEM64 family)